MKAADFYQLLEEQNYKCAYTGRILKPENTILVHKTPLSQGGKHEYINTELVDRDIACLARAMNHNELIDLAKTVQ